MALTAKRYIDPDQMKEDVAVNPADLDSAFVEQASLFAYYGEQSARAMAQVDRFKNMLELMEAKVAAKMREQAAKSGEKITEKRLEQEIAQHDKIQAMKKLVAEAKEVDAVAKSTLEALKHRRDMLVQMGADRREDKKGDLRLKAIEEGQRAKHEELMVRARRLNADADV